MNTHCTEDELLQFALSVLNGHAESRIRTHVVSCAQCATRLKGMEKSLTTLGKCEPNVSMDLPVLSVVQRRFRAPGADNNYPRGRSASGLESRDWNRFGLLVRFAAVLCVGIGIGYAGFGLFHPAEPTVLRQLIVPRASVLDQGGFTPCSVDGLRAR